MTKALSRNAAVLLASVLVSASVSPDALADGDSFVDRRSSPFMEEVAATQESEAAGWQSLYAAYACVCHHKWRMTSDWLREALREGGATQMLQSRGDLAYLCNGLSGVAAKQNQAAVPETSVNAQVLQALITSKVGETEEAIDALKRVIVNNPTYPALKFLKEKLREMEFERSNHPWMTPPDVAQIGGRSNRFSKWRSDKFPLKVYIPPDTVASRVAGYRAGDGELFRTAFDIWQKKSNGKIRFVMEPAKSAADIKCDWTSDQKELKLPDAVGVCSRTADRSNYLVGAEIKVLTFSTDHANFSKDEEFRKNYLQEVCLHEIGHSLGLNHSASEKDLMCPRVHIPPVTNPTGRDLTAMTSLYLSNIYETIGAALDAVDSGKYKAALILIEKALAKNPGDSQARDALCACSFNAATKALQDQDYETAIKLLTKARDLTSASRSDDKREQVLKTLHYAYHQAGKSKEARDLEKLDPSLNPQAPSSASFLDQYGLNREALPCYEEALAKNPDDLAVREKFCFLLVMLARDELKRNQDEEAISLLTRAKGMLRRGMPEEIIDKVIGELRRVYEWSHRYDEADQAAREGAALKPPPPAERKRTPQDDMADLVAAAKEAHPDSWASPAAEKSQYARLKSTYERYAAELRDSIALVHAKNRSGWAAALIVKYRGYDGRKPPNPLAALFELRHRLIDMTNESAVVAIECGLPFERVGP